jgi:tRNA (guanine10-N2)-dimethyltransferase
VYVLELASQDDDALARCEAESACTGVTALAPGLATARGLSDRVDALAFTRTAGELVGTCDPDVASAVALLDAATLRRTGTIRVRARDIRALTGVSTSRAERQLGGVLSDRGYDVDLEDPDHELRALFSEGICALGWVAVETDRDFGTRNPTNKPFFQPGSMDPMLARALVNVAGARPGARLLDPMCGTGGVLVEAGLVGANVVGVDAQWKMVRGALANLDAYLSGVAYDTVRGDATRLPLRDDCVSGVVFDAPYGRQSKVVGDLRPLVSGALSEARRVADRAVVVADRSWAAAARDAGWTVTATFERPVHRSLTRFVVVLDAA